MNENSFQDREYVMQKIGKLRELEDLERWQIMGMGVLRIGKDKNSQLVYLWELALLGSQDGQIMNKN